MKITAVGCLHGYRPTLPGGDLLIVTGDLTRNDRESQYFEVFNWLHEQDYKKKIMIAGNHDTRMQNEDYHGPQGEMKYSFVYLSDSATEFEGLKIWGSPWTSRFDGINPHCCAFTVPHDICLADKFNAIPDDTDILVTHGPSWGILDQSREGFNCGSHSLRMAVEAVKPKLHVFSHIHEQGGNTMLLKHAGPNTICINCSVMDENYKPINKIMSFEI